MNNSVFSLQSKNYLVLILLSLLIFGGCKNDKRVITISGIVNQANPEGKLEGVAVDLFSQKTETGTFSYNFEKQATTISDADGAFKFEFEFSYYSAFKLVLSKDLYFSISKEFETEVLTDDKYFDEFNMYTGAYIRFHIVNQNPFDNNDKVLYRIENFNVECDGCCPSEFRSFEGYNIDETFECKVYGNEEYTIEFITIKNDLQTFPVRSVYCPAFETSNVELIF